MVSIKNKAKAILALFSWLDQHHFDYDRIVTQYRDDLRKELLSIRGIGSETADVLIVYILVGLSLSQIVTRDDYMPNSDMRIQIVTINLKRNTITINIYQPRCE